MPAGDRTGPWRLGPRTGRGLGYCSGFRAPGFMFPGPRVGFGRGFGFGRGLGRGMGFGRGREGWFAWPYWAYEAGWHPRFNPPQGLPFYPPSQEEEKAMLEEQATFLEEQLEQIRARLKKLKKAGKEKTSEK